MALLLGVGAVCTAEYRKNTNQDSRINFYFVTGFYSLNNICMVDMKTDFYTRRQENMDKKGPKQKK